MMGLKRALQVIPTLILIAALGVLFYPFYSDRQPPTVNVTLTSSFLSYRLRGSMRISDPKAGVKEVTVKIVGENGFEQTVFIGKGRKKELERELDFDLRFVPEGKFKLVVDARDASIWRNRTTRELGFLIDHTPPNIELSLKPPNPKQGGTLSIYAVTDEEVYPDYSVVDPNLFRRSSVRFYLVGSEGRRYRYQAILGLNTEAPPGRSNLFVSFSDLAGNRSYQRIEFKVSRSSFGIGMVNLPKDKVKLLTDPTLKEKDDRKLAQVREREGSSQKLWSGKFIMPAQGAITSPFGRFRVYNKGLARSRHMGVDIAGQPGAPVRAPNSGMVLFADQLNIHGKTIILDHGLGVRSYYYHLRKILVGAGDRVEKGQVIGEIGSTGRVTGAHLHWGMEVEGVFVDPIEWTRYEF
jgi:murein DD-endopeptidase MepM/ murein hydrolase activator NlpD